MIILHDILEKMMNVVFDLFTPSLRSSSRSLLRKLQIYFDALKPFWVSRHSQKTILYVFGIAQDPPATVPAVFVEDDADFTENTAKQREGKKYAH